jgi:hypothetical protein
MVRQVLDIGSNANDGSGDTLRAAMQKVNENFAELYNVSVDNSIEISGNNIYTSRSNDNINVTPAGTGVVTMTNLLIDNNISIKDNIITTTQSNSSLQLSTSGTGSVVVDSISLKDNTISTNVSNADLELSASGTGTVVLNSLSFPTTDGSAGQFLRTDGSGNLSWASTTGPTLNYSDIDDGAEVVASSAQYRMDDFPTTYRSAKYFVSIKDSENNKYGFVELNVVHNGLTAFVSTFGAIYSSGSDLATFDADISGSDVRVLVTPTGGGSYIYKFQRILIDA